MTTLDMKNPFNAPVYHEEIVSSTMDVSRQLAARGAQSGTVITADFQEAGRGRIRGRIWEMEKGAGLCFTVLLRYSRIEDIPAALTLRAGLAVSLAIEDCVMEASLSKEKSQGMIKIKWPNDIMIGGRKAAGILCEANEEVVHIGVGINVTQKEFPVHLREKAANVMANNDQFILNGGESFNNVRFYLLEKILNEIYKELDAEESGKDTGGESWKRRIERRLYKKGEQVLFIEGAAGSGREVRGRLAGIGDGGELIILPENENKERSFITGELVLERGT